ncbi:MAG: hypothetical protein IJD59_07360 [Clostridia bacterium]|nr:hypothetical protein [Clostridia bacterium]
MKYPKISELRTSREMLDVFRGYRHALRIGDGEFYEMENLSSDRFPILAPRAKRGVYASPGMAQGMIAKDALCYVDGGDFVMGDARVPMGLTADAEPKTLISMGAYVIIMPDKKYINTAALSDFGEIEAVRRTSAEITFSLCGADGANYENVIARDTAPTEPENLCFWLDTSSEPRVLRRYSASTDTWTAVQSSFIKIHSPGIGLPFAEGDGVFISGVQDASLSFLNGAANVTARTDDDLVVEGILDGVITQSAEYPITVERKMPDMDFIIESENRLWGCHYGGGVNEIYASKLGDFRNWNCFTGISTDSYAASVGTDGAFTGAITHLGYPLFFKEGCVHKIYGNIPSNFQIQTTSLRGVQKGCARSLAIVGEILYYKSRSGVCAYDGSLPLEISDALGEEAYKDAAAGALGNKYYISMADSAGDHHLFVYDTLRDMWHREDGTQAVSFCAHGGELYYIDYATGQILTVRGTGVCPEEPIRWSATTGILGTDSPDKKYISRLDVRMRLDVGASVSFYAEYDSGGEYEYLFTMTGKNLQSFSVPVRPRRCDHLRLRIVGRGDAKIFSICKTLEWGGDRG